MNYFIDTSSLIHAWHEAYPCMVFRSLWDRIEDLVEDGRIIAPDVVLTELKQKEEDDLFAWAKARPNLFIPLEDPIQLGAIDVLARYPKLINLTKQGESADPFLIAIARELHGTVVTQENRIPSKKKDKIPLVCDSLGVPCTDILGLIRAEGWRF